MKKAHAGIAAGALIAGVSLAFFAVRSKADVHAAGGLGGAAAIAPSSGTAPSGESPPAAVTQSSPPALSNEAQAAPAVTPSSATASPAGDAPAPAAFSQGGSTSPAAGGDATPAASARGKAAKAGALPVSLKAPDFTLRDLKGKKVRLSNFRGKVVFLDFWATWCPPCRQSFPAVEALNKQYSSRGLQILGVSVDEDVEAVAPFVKEMGATYTVLTAKDNPVGARYGVDGIPAFFLIDKNGNVAGQWVGFDPEFTKEWRKSIDKLLPS